MLTIGQSSAHNGIDALVPFSQWSAVNQLSHWHPTDYHQQQQWLEPHGLNPS